MSRAFSVLCTHQQRDLELYQTHVRFKRCCPQNWTYQSSSCAAICASEVLHVWTRQMRCSTSTGDTFLFIQWNISIDGRKNVVVLELHHQVHTVFVVLRALLFPSDWIICYPLTVPPSPGQNLNVLSLWLKICIDIPVSLSYSVFSANKKIAC